MFDEVCVPAPSATKHNKASPPTAKAAKKGAATRKAHKEYRVERDERRARERREDVAAMRARQEIIDKPKRELRRRALARFGGRIPKKKTK